MTFRLVALYAFLASAMVCLFSQSSRAINATHPRFDSFEKFAASELPKGVLWDVIARKGRSKTYRQLVPLDGGTVGIANFAVGGLTSLYSEMDTGRYFGRTKGEMIRNYSSNCRPKGRRGNDTGWGCYSIPWWRRGMQRFLRSPDTIAVQERAWLRNIESTVRAAISRGWNTPRELAIAAGIGNSLGSRGFQQLATDTNWDAERAIQAYGDGSAHRNRRRDAINLYFPN